jgi:D-alanine-D-alanine ligase
MKKTDKNIKVAVLTGGDSSERTVALQSTKGIIGPLRDNYDVKVFDFPKGIDTFLKEYKNYHVAIPVFHGPGGEDGQIQGLLNVLGLPFIFSDVEAHALGMNKAFSKEIVSAAGLLAPKHKVLSTGENFSYQKPIVIKPVAGGSSIGINIAKDQASTNNFIKQALQYDKQVLVEDYLVGEEFTVPIVEYNDKTISLPVIQIKSKRDFFDYQSKYDPDLVEEICPAPINQTLARELQGFALQVHKLLGARHLSRSDFIVSKNKVYFLEINTIPGMTKESLLPKAIQAANLDFTDLLDQWIKSSIKPLK